MSEHSNPRAQPSQLHPVTRKPNGPVIPVTTILGTSRMVPNDAVLRWPRLYWGRAAKIHTHIQLQTQQACRLRQTGSPQLDWKHGPHTHAEHTVYVQGQHAARPFQTLWSGTVVLSSAQTTAGIQLQCCLDKTFNKAI